MQVRPNGWCSVEDLGRKQGYSRIKGKQSFLLLVLLSFLSSTGVLGDEATSLKPESSKNNSYQPDQSGEFFSQLSKYVSSRWVWGLIDEVHFTEEGTAEVNASRLGNSSLLKTPFGGFLWGYERGWGEAALFPRRNNVFAGRFRKQPFVSGKQDVRDYGYVIDTRRLRKWLQNEAAGDILLRLPVDIRGHFIFSNSDASVGDRRFVNFVSESYESFQSELHTHVNKGSWYGLGFDFMFISYNPTTLGKFTVVDQKEVIDRDLFLGRITFPVLESFHISGYYDEDHDVHRFTNTNVPSVGGVPLLLVPDRSIHSTQRKWGPEGKYFFGEDLHKAVSMAFYMYTGESAGRLAEYGLQRAFRIDSAGQFSPLELHNSFGLGIGYQEYYKREHRDDIKWEKWGVNVEAGYLDSGDVSRPFSGTIFLLKRPSGASFRRPTTVVRQFDEALNESFIKGEFTYHFNPRDKTSHPLAGELHTEFSFWNIERNGKQTQEYPLLGEAEVIRSFRDDRRILQLSTSYELARPRHHFGGVYFLGANFNWDVETSDKVGRIDVGFFY